MLNSLLSRVSLSLRSLIQSPVGRLKMSHTNKDHFDKSYLGATLPAGGGALNAEDPVGLVNSLKNLVGQHSDAPSPSTVRKRGDFLREIESEHYGLQAKLCKERAALEAKYQKLFEPLYAKRCEIVNGVIEVEGVKSKDEKGVPEFWLTAMKTNEILAEEITERDEEALKYLKDIKWFRTDNPKGFKLEFFFDSNPFFKNSVLTKAYHVVEVDEPILERAIGTDIEWLPGKCLTHAILKKKPKKGSNDAKTITKNESFFNFFDPPQVPDDDEDIDDEFAEELKNRMQRDYKMGCTLCFIWEGR